MQGDWQLTSTLHLAIFPVSRNLRQEQTCLSPFQHLVRLGAFLANESDTIYSSTDYQDTTMSTFYHTLEFAGPLSSQQFKGLSVADGHLR